VKWKRIAGRGGPRRESARLDRDRDTDRDTDWGIWDYWGGAG
jgi:hypothetical protein